MLIKVYVTPNAKQARVVKVSEDYFEVWVDARAVGGRANKRLLEILGEHFNVPKSRITVVKGTKARDKTIQIMPQDNAKTPLTLPENLAEREFGR
jgi:uncharacterized protein